MKYMLVLQWPSSSTADELEFLISLEDEITENIGGYGEVDGRDIGSGEMNIFIFTDDPKSAFEHTKSISSISQHMANLKVGYREIGQEDFVPLYPVNLSHFGIV